MPNSNIVTAAILLTLESLVIRVFSAIFPNFSLAQAHPSGMISKRGEPMKHQKRILLVITGNTIPQVRAVYGNTDSHFENLIGSHNLAQRFEIFSETEATSHPEPNDFDGVVMTGSASMLDEDRPWMRACKRLVNKCLEDKVPYLGVCFGHQVLGAVCGAQIGENPNGRSLGSRLFKITHQSPIFEALPATLWVQTSHRDVILNDRADFQIIGSADHDQRHAIQVGERAFGIQFHPEWDMDISRGYIEARRDILGEAVAIRMMATLNLSPHAPLVVKKFIELCGQKK